jgi:hypothetical protein
MAASSNYELTFLRLLEISPFERRARGGWRFGTKVISDAVVDRLVAGRRALIEGDRVLPICARKGEPADTSDQAPGRVAKALAP